MFNKKRLEEQQETINRLRRECRKLQETIKTLTEENMQLKKIAEKESNAKTTVVSKSINRTYNNITLTDEQNSIVDLLENTNDNYFVTGKAGTGKSTVLNCFKKTSRKKNIAVVAPTGAAAINVEGQTIHSLFRLDLEPQDVYSNSKVKPDPVTAEVLAAINVLIIDEVSMVRSDIMDMIDAKLRSAKGNNLLFGGCQVITFGDLYQLPPIAKDRLEKEFIEDRYGTLFFFGSPAVKKSFKILELKEVIRQKDSAFVKILNHVREGTASETDIQTINTRYTPNIVPDDCVRITLINETANNINKQKLSAINKKEFQFVVELGGNSPPAKDDVPFDFDLRLKVGARIMMTQNDPGKRYVNGSIGIVSDLSQNCIEVNIDGKNYIVEQQVWKKRAYKYNKSTKELSSEIIGWAKQYPLRLAWAITIHKSQGQTYDKVIIDYNGRSSFAAGQTYVALSRCKTLNGVYLTQPLYLNDIHVDPDVKAYMQGEEVNKTNLKPAKYADEEPAFISFENDYPF